MARVGVGERTAVAVAQGEGLVVFGDAARHLLDGESEGNFCHRFYVFWIIISIRARFGIPSVLIRLCYDNVTIMFR